MLSQRALLKRRRAALTTYIRDIAPSLRAGDSIDFEYLEVKKCPSALKRLLETRGLGFCAYGKKIFDLDAELYPVYRGRRLDISTDGMYRHNLLVNCVFRAKRTGVPYDSAMLKQLIFGQLPRQFCGVPYRGFVYTGVRGPQPNS